MVYLRSFLALFLLGGTLSIAEAELPKLIPRDVLFGNPEKVSPKISPNGKYLAYIAPDNRNVLQVWVRTIGKNDDRKLTNDKKRGIRSYFWTYDGKHLVYLQDKAGDENYHLYGVNIHNGKVRDLTPFKGVRAQVVDVDPSSPNELLVGLNRKDRRKFDVYRIHLNSGDVKFDTKNPGNVVDWTADSNFRVRAATAMTPDGGNDLLVRKSPKADWKTLRHWGPDEKGSAVAFSKNGNTLYVLANHDANASRLLAVDLQSKKEKVLAEDPQYDVGSVMTDPTTHEVQAVSFNRAKLEWKALDKKVAADFDVLRKAHQGEFRVVNRDQADNTWLVSYSQDDGPVNYYVYDRGTKKLDFLFSHRPKLKGLPLASMKPISFKARDGLTIHGYLSTPVGVPAENLPTVLLVHGGPWSRDSWGYSPTVQWLANRGYAVLQLNYRGSTGYGKKFLNAGNKEWAAKMHDDLIDGVKWIIKQGVAHPDKIAIMGGSYGGYATLVGLTFTPDVFAAGVDIVGPSNLVTLLKSIPPYWAPAQAMFAKRVGDVKDEQKFLKSRSPLFFVDKIKAPLLIGQGANDPRVKKAEADQIFDALRKAKKPVKYLLYTDEGHGFARPENRMHFYAHAEQFLAKHLGGRAEPIGNIEGHSGVVVKHKE